MITEIPELLMLFITLSTSSAQFRPNLTETIPEIILRQQPRIYGIWKPFGTFATTSTTTPTTTTTCATLAACCRYTCVAGNTCTANMMLGAGVGCMTAVPAAAAGTACSIIAPCAACMTFAGCMSRMAQATCGAGLPLCTPSNP